MDPWTYINISPTGDKTGKIHPGSLLPMGCPIIDSNNMAVQRRKTDRQTDRQTDLPFF